MSFQNIEIIRTSGGITLDFSDESVDVVLLYDVLHYLEKTERVTLYGDDFLNQGCVFNFIKGFYSIPEIG